MPDYLPPGGPGRTSSERRTPGRPPLARAMIVGSAARHMRGAARRQFGAFHDRFRQRRLRVNAVRHIAGNRTQRIGCTTADQRRVTDRDRIIGIDVVARPRGDDDRIGSLGTSARRFDKHSRRATEHRNCVKTNESGHWRDLAQICAGGKARSINHSILRARIMNNRSGASATS